MKPPVHLAGMLVGLLVAVPVKGQPGGAGHPLARAERAWLELRTLDDQLRLTRNLGAAVSPRGVALHSLRTRLRRQRELVRDLLAKVPVHGLGPSDAAAARWLGHELAQVDAEVAPEAALPDPPDCAGPFPERLRQAAFDSIRAHTFACYGAAARRIIVGSDTLDRLSILGLLGRTDDPERRRRLFLALMPVWRSVNGDDSIASPYRAMVRLRNGAGREWPMAARARDLAVAPDSVEAWLVEVLGAWRRTLPDTLVEPWDFYYRTGEASRLLSPRIPLDSLRPLVTRFYAALGANLELLRVHFDLVPRPGKYPISFTDFGARHPVEPWIFTSYRIGGLDNLAELLHEAGHAIHIAAIQTRGAYVDWPDSDTFTEAIADLAALDVFEPEWQRRNLGSAAPLGASLRDKYSAIVLDVAWALFEIRSQRHPEQSPNQIWTQITRDCLGIRPHPEWSWWAMRGQLVDSPGYMLNYALGAVLIADLRATAVAKHGNFTTGDASWYGWIARRLYRFGREVPARDVVRRFLGRGISVRPILQDLARAASP